MDGFRSADARSYGLLVFTQIRVNLLSKLIALVTLCGYSLGVGCSSVRTVPMSADVKSGDKIYGVTLMSGEVVEFDDNGGIVNSYRGTIDGKTRDGRDVAIKLGDVKSVRMNKTNGAESVVWTVIVVGAVVALVALLLGDTGHYSFP